MRQRTRPLGACDGIEGRPEVQAHHDGRVTSARSRVDEWTQRPRRPASTSTGSRFRAGRPRRDRVPGWPARGRQAPIVCHETGHAVGLVHGSDSDGTPATTSVPKSSSSLGCMATPVNDSLDSLPSFERSEINATSERQGLLNTVDLAVGADATSAVRGAVPSKPLSTLLGSLADSPVDPAAVPYVVLPPDERYQRATSK
jgi:hypothetical protein